METLHETPKDDWEGTRPPQIPQGEHCLYLNMHMAENQIAMHMIREFGKPVFLKQFPRVMAMMCFLSHNLDILERDHLLIRGSSSCLIDDCLIESLAVLPISKHVDTNPGTYEFDYGEVSSYAKRLQEHGGK